MTHLQVIDREIPEKGKCYVICTEYDAADFDAQMARVIETARIRGAMGLYFACRDPAQTFGNDGYTLGGCAFCYDTTFDILEKPLPDANAAVQPHFRTKRMRIGNAPLYAALYNESFYAVPNSRTLDEAELARMLDDGQRDAGFFMLGGDPAGVYELDYREFVPEIAAIAIRPEYRKKGYGARGLHTLEARLADEGHGRVQMLVARSNEAAYALYLARGYVRERALSRWFLHRIV